MKQILCDRCGKTDKRTEGPSLIQLFCFYNTNYDLCSECTSEIVNEIIHHEKVKV